MLQIAIMLGSALMMVALLLLVHKTRLGMAMRATAQNREVAGLMGVNINTVVISAAFSDWLSPGRYCRGDGSPSYFGVAQYTMGFMLGLKSLYRCRAGAALAPGRCHVGRPAAGPD